MDLTGKDSEPVEQPVWLGMTARELDDAYDQSVWAPYAQRVALRRQDACRRAVQSLGEPARIAYGPSEAEALLLYRCERRKAPIFLFVHGGAWRGGSAAQSLFAVENILDAGAHFIAVDFSDVIAAGGDLRLMAGQVRRAIAWTHAHADELGGDPERLVLFGHSSGAHLAGCALAWNWAAEGLGRQPIRAALLSSGMYDLAPVRLSKRSAYVAFTDEIVAELSALRCLDGIAAELVLSYGTAESPEFQRQTQTMHAALAAAGKPAELLVGVGLDHFEIQETLANPYGCLGRAARTLIARAAA